MEINLLGIKISIHMSVKRETRVTRYARIVAHRYFDILWKSRTMSRRAAYRYLFTTTGEWHIKNMSKKKCQKLVEQLKREFPKIFINYKDLFEIIE